MFNKAKNCRNFYEKLKKKQYFPILYETLKSY